MNYKDLEKVDVDKLRIGMYVAELDRPWLDTPFLFQGFPIRNQDELDQLCESCEYVYIDVEKSIDWHADLSSHLSSHANEQVHFTTQAINSRPPHRKIEYRDRAPFAQVLPEAILLHRAAKDYIGKVLEDIRLGNNINTQSARELADRLSENIIKNENAMVWLTLLKNRDEYTLLHSINVAVLSLLFGRFLGLTEEELRPLALGALLHDIGKMRVPKTILNKPGSLSLDEHAIMKRHPSHGHKILSGHRDLHPAVAEIALSHHERFDGSGYPRGLKGKAINQYALIVSIIDVYDAVTSDRAYHIGISPHEALNMMYKVAATCFPRELVEAFIQCLGIYPIGSLVELDSGEVGVVMTVNRRHQLSPVLTMVLDRNKNPVTTPKMINLELYARNNMPKRIKSILQSNAYGIDVRKLIQQVHMTMPPAMV